MKGCLAIHYHHDNGIARELPSRALLAAVKRQYSKVRMMYQTRANAEVQNNDNHATITLIVSWLSIIFTQSSECIATMDNTP